MVMDPSLRSTAGPRHPRYTTGHGAARVSTAAVGAHAGVQLRRALAAGGDWIGRNQLYTNWELCIADDHSSDPRVAEVLREIQARDGRVKLHFREVNGHISAASNSALALASGEFIVLLDHDDVLPRHALAAVVHELNRHPDADIVYSDEDRIDEAGRYDPYFKPDWNPELFYGQNLISHLGVYRTPWCAGLVDFGEGFEGSQDYEMALGESSTQPGSDPAHPTRPLSLAGDTRIDALDVDQKSYATGAARLAVQEHFARTGVQATIEPAPNVPYYQRVRYRCRIRVRTSRSSFRPRIAWTSVAGAWAASSRAPPTRRLTS